MTEAEKELNSDTGPLDEGALCGYSRLGRASSYESEYFYSNRIAILGRLLARLIGLAGTRKQRDLLSHAGHLVFEFGSEDFAQPQQYRRILVDHLISCIARRRVGACRSAS